MIKAYAVTFETQRKKVITHFTYRVLAHNIAEAKSFVAEYQAAMGHKAHAFHFEAHPRPMDWKPIADVDWSYRDWTHRYVVGELHPLDTA